ncbi:hypothetical protein HYV43_02580 [Candidatus Micrarchaeota archaeon]|nr:hypothetical protein [Candidatus Micrarchaeota archaeon]
MKLENLPLDKIMLVLIVAGVFAAAFFFAQLVPKGADQTLEGVRVVATGDAKAQLGSLLARDPVLIQMNLFAGNDSRNTALSVVTAEIASTLINYQKRNFVYGAVDGNASVNCVSETNFCQGAVIFVQIGPLNGMKIDNDRVVVEGSEDFFRNTQRLRVIKGVFGLAASGS